MALGRLLTGTAGRRIRLLRGDQLSALRWTVPMRGNLLPVHWGFVIAALPLLAATLFVAGQDTSVVLLVRIGYCLGLAWLVCRLFALRRGRTIDPQWPMHAVLFALLVPFDAGIAATCYGLVVGLVFGALVFGGVGRYLASPALVGALMLALSYPTATDASGAALASGWLNADAATPAAVSPAAAAAGALLLVMFGHASYRVLAGGVVGIAIGAAAAGGIAEAPALAATGTGAFCLAFLVTDPTAASVTRIGRFVYGLSFGVLFAVLLGSDPLPPRPALAAGLAAALSAPLIDYAVLRLRRRERAHG